MRSKLLLLVAFTLAVMLAMTNVLGGHAQPVEGSGPDLSKIDPAIVQLINSGAKGRIPVIVHIDKKDKAKAISDKGKGLGNQSTKASDDLRKQLAKESDDLRKQAARDAEDLIKQKGGEKKRSLDIVNGSSGLVPPSAIEALSRNPKVEYISYDAPVGAQGPFTGDMVDYSVLVNAPAVWAMGYTGAGGGVAAIDSGIQPNASAGLPANKIVASVNLASDTALDPGGHGTHIAGIIGGKGADWSGVAPGVNLINVRVLEQGGGSTLSQVIAGVQWVISNRKQYNIRVMNLSLGGLPSVSYKYDPLASAVESAWQSGIVVIAAAGNTGDAPGTIHTPGHDPYVVTVGALDPAGTLDRTDDSIAFYSSRGPTLAGQTKPDLVAAGRKVVSVRAPGSYLDTLLPDRVVDNLYFRLSGTSQATAVVSGVAALLIQKYPNLKPDQVKYLLKRGTIPLPNVSANVQGVGSIDAYAAATTPAGSKDNRGLRPADRFASMGLAAIVKTTPPTWKDPTFHNGVDSRNITWDNLTWDNITWDNLTWDNLFWDNITWDNLFWDNVTWDNITWDSAFWDSIGWDSFTAD